MQIPLWIRRRRKAVFLLLFLCGCQSDSWEVAHVQTGNSKYDSARLSYPTRDPVNGIAMELICAGGEMRSYLEVHTHTIPPYLGNPKEALVTVKVGDTITRAIGDRHAGGQRLSLPPDLHDLVVQSLQCNQPVTIQLQGFSTTIDPKNFTAHFEQMRSSPIKNPFHLPFEP